MTDELLCYCLSMETETIKTDRLEQLSTSEWERLLQQADRHGVTPLLYHRLKTLGSDANIPVSILQRLRKTYLTSAARNVHLYHELSNVLAVLQKADIPVIVLKGAHLAEIVYGNIALRPMSDTDLLIKRQDLARSQQKLLETGYLPRNN